MPDQLVHKKKDIMFLPAGKLQAERAADSAFRNDVMEFGKIFWCMEADFHIRFMPQRLKFFPGF